MSISRVPILSAGVFPAGNNGATLDSSGTYQRDATSGFASADMIASCRLCSLVMTLSTGRMPPRLAA